MLQSLLLNFGLDSFELLHVLLRDVRESLRKGARLSHEMWVGPDDVSYSRVLDLAIANLVNGRLQSWGVSSHVAHEDLALRFGFRSYQSIDIAVAERERLFHQDMLVVVQSADGMADMKGRRAADEHGVYILGTAQVVDFLSALRRGARDFAGTVL